MEGLKLLSTCPQPSLLSPFVLTKEGSGAYETNFISKICYHNFIVNTIISIKIKDALAIQPEHLPTR